MAYCHISKCAQLRRIAVAPCLRRSPAAPYGRAQVRAMSASTDTPIHILGVSGSLRKASTNTGLLRAAAKVLPPGVTFEIADLHGIPPFDQDVEDAGIPPAVVKLTEQLARADAVLFASPEYNFTISSPLKAAIDWASRGKNSWDNKAAAIVGAGGGSGSSRSHYHLRQAGVFLNLHFINRPEVALRRFADPTLFDETTGDLVSESTIAYIGKVMGALAEWTRRIKV